MAPAVLTFLKAHNWHGKTVIPFQTHGGWPGHTIKDMKQACQGAEFAFEMAVRFDSEGGADLITSDKEINDWLAQILGGLKK